MSISRLSRAAIVAALLSVLGAAALLAAGDSAHADDPPTAVTAAPDLEWGVKASWRSYAQPPQVSDGAQVIDTPGGDSYYQLGWEFEAGSYDPTTRTTRLDYSGTVHWQKYKASELGRTKPPGYTGPETDPYLLDVTISDPQITISRDESVLTAIVSSRDQLTWELNSYGRVPVVSLDVIGVTPTVAAGTTTWAGIVAAVTAQGSAAFARNYLPGQIVDGVGFSYTGPGGAPDFSEHWDEPGKAILKLVQNELYVDGDTSFSVAPLWIDREDLVVHSSSEVVIEGVPSRKIEAFDLKTMQALGDPLILPSAEAPAWPTNIVAVDSNDQRLLYRQTGEQGAPRWFRFNPATEQYEKGTLSDPQMGQTAFVGANAERLAWDPTRDRGFRIARVVPVGVGATEYDLHEWTLFTFEEGEDGVWVKKAFELPSFPAGQNQTGYAPTILARPSAAAASDGSLIVLASTRQGLASTADIPAAYRIVFNEADDAVSVQPLPVQVRNSPSAGVFQNVRTGPDGRILLIQTEGGSKLVECQIDAAGVVTCDPPIMVGDHVEGPFEERRYAIDSADGTVWYASTDSKKLGAFKDGTFRGATVFKERNPRGGPVLVGDDHFVYAQTSDGSAAETGGSKTWGFGKFERLGFVPTVAAQPQPDAVALSVGEVSEEANFSSTASGEPSPIRQWQLKAPGSNKFVDVAGATGPTLSVAATREDDGSEYRAIYANAAGKMASEVAALSVEYAPRALQSPANVKVLEGQDAEFAVLADGKPQPTVVWQRKVGGFWEDVTDEDESIVVEGNSLTVQGSDPEQTGARFRARLVNSLGTVNSEEAKLTVTPKVVIPPGGVGLDKVELEWSGSEELQKAPPFGGSNYFSAGVSHGDAASFRGHEGNAFAFQVTAGGAEAVSTWATRADHVTNGGAQLVRLYGGDGAVEEDGSALVEWSGAFSVNFYGGLAPFTISDPVLAVDEDGEGRLSADLVGCASSQANPSQCTPLPAAADVTVATFSGVEVDPAGALTVTPDYAGVEVEVPAPPLQNRTAAGWGAWPQPFVDYHVQTGLAPYWYSSGGVADPDKPPAPFTVDFEGSDPPLVDQVSPDGGAKPAPAAPVPPSVSAAKGVQAVGPKRRAKVATLRCPGTSPCKVRAPRNAPVRIGGRTYWAEVFAPATIPAGGSAVVRARLAAAALAALGEGRATLRVQLQVRSDEGLAKLLARVPIEAAG